jgi:NADH dehydrogenase/NADH:ubiquinone oxidoreductase subunit G
MDLKMTINDKEIFFEQGKTILEIARENDLYIPSLCYHYKTGQAGIADGLYYDS